MKTQIKEDPLHAMSAARFHELLKIFKMKIMQILVIFKLQNKYKIKGVVIKCSKNYRSKNQKLFVYQTTATQLQFICNFYYK